jgi:hypothetical protein
MIAQLSKHLEQQGYRIVIGSMLNSHRENESPAPVSNVLTLLNPEDQ